MNDLTPIKLSRLKNTLPADVLKACRVNVGTCFHCKTCSNGCPFLTAMDIPPNAVIRMVQLGLEDTVLTSKTIWTCVGCNTCSTECPMAVDMAAVMDALRQRALDKGVTPSQPEVLAFHQEVINSIERYGRTHKLEIMMRFKLKRFDLFSDLNVGLKMLRKRKLDLTPSRVADMDRVRDLFSKSRKESRHG